MLSSPVIPPPAAIAPPDSMLDAPYQPTELVATPVVAAPLIEIPTETLAETPNTMANGLIGVPLVPEVSDVPVAVPADVTPLAYVGIPSIFPDQNIPPISCSTDTIVVNAVPLTTDITLGATPAMPLPPSNDAQPITVS